MKTNKKMLEEDSSEYRKMAISTAFNYCPLIYPCADCGGPVVTGYCCCRCGSADHRDGEDTND